MRKFFRLEGVIDNGVRTAYIALVDTDKVTSLKCRNHTGGNNPSYHIYKDGSDWLEFRELSKRDEVFNLFSEFILSSNADVQSIITKVG